VFACGGCGGVAVQVVSGEEFLVTSLELARQPDGQGSPDKER
jgi:Zn finger protein HypA/HybF involved in hydrogenase expression